MSIRVLDGSPWRIGGHYFTDGRDREAIVVEADGWPEREVFLRPVGEQEWVPGWLVHQNADSTTEE